MRPSKKLFAAFVHMNSVNNIIFNNGNEISLQNTYNVANLMNGNKNAVFAINVILLNSFPVPFHFRHMYIQVWPSCEFLRMVSPSCGLQLDGPGLGSHFLSRTLHSKLVM